MNIQCINSVQFSHSVMSDSLWPNGLQHARPACPSPTPGDCSCHGLMSIESVIPSCPLLSPSTPNVNLSQKQGLFKWVSSFYQVAKDLEFQLQSVLPINIQDWLPLGWTDWISLQPKGLSKVFSNTTVQKHQFFGTQLSSQSNSHIHTWLLEKP